MSLFLAELSNPAERARLALWLQLGALVTTGLLIAQTSPFLPWSHLPLAHLILQSTVLTAVAWIATAAMTMALYVFSDYVLVPDWTGAELRGAVLRTAATAVWFVPAIVLASVFHPGALAAALVLVHNITRLLYAQWRLTRPNREQPLAAADSFFKAGAAGSPVLIRELGSRLLVSLCLQASVVAVLFREYSLARGLFYASTAMLTILVMTVSDYRPETGSSIWRSTGGLVLSLLLAGGLTVGSLAPRARGNGSGGGKETAGYPADPAKQTPGVPRPIYSPTGENFPADSVPGVILWPEIKPVPTLIAPVPAGHGRAPRTTPQQPMSIPFSGEYWIYRWPYARPPHNSFVKRGNPAALSFRTTDHRPLQMEAHHRLDQPISLRCCSEIQVAIRNADSQPGSISLEVVLMNTEVRPVLRQSLGKSAVMPVGDQAASGVGMPQTVQFTVPANSALEEFNEFQVIFLRDLRRMNKSAKIAIERFVLVPR